MILNLIRYIVRYYYRKISLWLTCRGKPQQYKDLYRAAFGYHPLDFKQDLSAWRLLRKMPLDSLQLIILDNIFYCESLCDNVTQPDKSDDCEYCYMLSLKSFFDKWHPEKSHLIGRFDK